MRVLAINRARVFSPGNVENDAAILQSVAALLRKEGHTVEIISEEKFVADVDSVKGTDKESRRKEELFNIGNAELVLSMARSEDALKRLRGMEDVGIRVINTPQGVANCRRTAMTRLLAANNIPMPESRIVNINNSSPLSVAVGSSADSGLSAVASGFLPLWLKRGDGHVMEKEDVVFCATEEELYDGMDKFRERGVAELVINRHLEGDLVKFYGVRGSGWLHWSYASDTGKSKYGFEEINGKARRYPFSEEKLRNMADAAAEVLDLDVYGGDCVVASDGSVRIIDFNDWPSFSSCRSEAAHRIILKL